MAIYAIILLLEKTFSVRDLYWKVSWEESQLSRALHGKQADSAVGTVSKYV